MKDRAVYILIGIDLESNVSFSIDSFSFSISKITIDIEKQVGSISTDEKVYLSIEGVTSLEDFLDKAQAVKNLLSLALGKRIIFNKQLYYQKDEIEFVSREMAAPINEGPQIIPDARIGKYLQQVYAKYSTFSKEDRDQFFTCTDYLNQTKNGFIEDRVLHTAIAWESFADYLKQSSILPPNLLELRLLLKESIGDWRNSNPNNDPKGELGSRILAAVDREKLMDKLINLASHFNLDYNLLGIDFYKLKELRDLVAHTGRISITGAEAYHIMNPAIRGLQIILLTWLDYSGLVYSSRNGWKTTVPIKNSQLKTD